MQDEIRLAKPLLNPKQSRDKYKSPTKARNRAREYRLRDKLKIELGFSEKPPEAPREIPYDTLPEDVKNHVRAVNRKRTLKRRDQSLRYIKKNTRDVRIYQSRIAGAYRVCIYCNKELPAASFDRRKDGKNKEPGRGTDYDDNRRKKLGSFRSYCYKCRSDKNREYYINNKDKWRKHNDT